eukprot:CAMPEP_0177193036 /NCGR_PEP_ID=MMETSP0367-20130122/22222_1 /TAXON_ID=447022 ORGANISM="Scrippsiella hangoei-like, Strain SHHI-4" /NCGR_SAMPLE_ID=MMETSP0367 /ASSEMBLY_ACC=CAM_ASM_000362 /LENGTH=602 /DNA_ID=CAMNT_0018640883 /DNA_START=162 /DNA_END=1970 /DNA_ORIENTATION=-
MTVKAFQVRVAERSFPDEDRNHPVRLVVFDLDETLTLTTFMSEDGTYDEGQHEFTTLINFESPWVQGCRVEKLRRMFEELAESREGERRAIAVLTRNSHREGVRAVLNLLKVSHLDEHIDAIWTMPARMSIPSGAYRHHDGTWRFFDPPVGRLLDHKVSVLKSVAAQPKAWLPQLKSEQCPEALKDLGELRLENIVLVDDQEANFQNGQGRLLRYAKVTRYHATYHDLGYIEDMGGIGAHDDQDFALLKNFVEDPWLYKETLKMNCMEIRSEQTDQHLPVRLIVFDFDETLTMATFLPDDNAFNSDIDWRLSGQNIGTWRQGELLLCNWESPWVKGRRLKRLQTMLAQLKKGKEGPRELVILAPREGSAVSIVNLLKVGRLDGYFSAVWTFPPIDGVPNGVYKEGGVWKTFDPPLDEVRDNSNKSEVLKHILENTPAWLPQLSGGDLDANKLELLRLVPENVVLVDNEPMALTGRASRDVPRLCKVMRYDENYRDCGLLYQMGGIGAHTSEDFDLLVNFVKNPWEYPCELPDDGEEVEPIAERMSKRLPSMRRFSDIEGDWSRTPRGRAQPASAAASPNSPRDEGSEGTRSRSEAEGEEDEG